MDAPISIVVAVFVGNLITVGKLLACSNVGEVTFVSIVSVAGYFDFRTTVNITAGQSLFVILWLRIDHGKRRHRTRREEQIPTWFISLGISQL